MCSSVLCAFSCKQLNSSLFFYMSYQHHVGLQPANLVTIYISVRRREVSVRLTVITDHFSMERGYSGTVYWLHKIALYHPESQNPDWESSHPSKAPVWDSFSGNRVGDWFPGIPDSPSDPRLPSGIPPRLIPDSKIPSQVKSSHVVARSTVQCRRNVIYHQYQDLDNQNSKHKIKACRTISSSNSILKIDSIFLMALLC